MLKKMLAVFTSVVAGLALVGIAWAGSGDDDSAAVAARGSTDVSTGVTAEASSTGGTTAASTDARASSSTDATVDVSTPTTIDDDDDSTTSTSVAATSSSSAESSTSTSVDGDDDARVSVSSGITTHVVPGVGTVTISAFNGTLTLVSVVTSWQIEEQRVETDRIEIEFASGDAEAEFEARVDGPRIEVGIETD